ncbi:MAG TPA: Ku protein [Longimicrobium sp.]|nr:Ku protein [Longimicrobium sp.]
MGSRSTWNGTVTFGLLTIPVGLYTAVREQDLSFKQLCPTHSAPIQMKRFCTQGQEEVAYGDLVKGYEVGPGDFIVLREEDFEHAARPIPRTFDLQVFVAERDVDLRFFHTPYFVVPKAEGARTYALLREAIRRTGKVGIGRIALKTKRQIAALRVLGDALVLQLMHWPDELEATSGYAFPDAELQQAEVELAEQLVANFAGELSAAEFTDDYRVNLQRIIEARVSGEEIDLPQAPEPEASGVIDLVAALRASLAARQAA